jgi:hypothetical protein
MIGENQGKTCDLADWISYFAWDFLGDAGQSKRMGFMEKGKDVGSMLETAKKVIQYFYVVSTRFGYLSHGRLIWKRSLLLANEQIHTCDQLLTLLRLVKFPIWRDASARTPTSHPGSTSSTTSRSRPASRLSASWSVCRTPTLARTSRIS